MRKTTNTIMLAVLITTAASLPSSAESAREVWGKAITKIDAIKDYQCILHAFMWDTPAAIKLRPKNADGKDNPETWYVFKLGMKWKQPGYSYFKVLGADNPGLDMATEYIKRKPGTAIVFGFKDTIDLYGKFPKTGDATLDNMVDKYYFQVPATAFEGARKEIGFNTDLKKMAAYLEHYFSNGTVELDKVEFTFRKNFRFDSEKRKLRFESEESSRPFYRFTMTPDNPDKNLGVTKEILYINPTSLLPIQMETYEGDTLVVAIHIEDIKTNAGIDDSIWDDFYKKSKPYPAGTK